MGPFRCPSAMEGAPAEPYAHDRMFPAPAVVHEYPNSPDSAAGRTLIISCSINRKSARAAADLHASGYLVLGQP